MSLSIGGLLVNSANPVLSMLTTDALRRFKVHYDRVFTTSQLDSSEDVFGKIFVKTNAVQRFDAGTNTVTAGNQFYLVAFSDEATIDAPQFYFESRCRYTDM